MKNTKCLVGIRGEPTTAKENPQKKKVTGTARTPAKLPGDAHEGHTVNHSSLKKAASPKDRIR